MQSRFNSLHGKKKKKWPKILFGSLAGILVAVVVVWIAIHDWDINRSINALEIQLNQGDILEEVIEHENQEETPELEEEPKEQDINKDTPIVEKPVEEEIDMSGSKGYEGNEELPKEPTYVEGIIVASKKYPLPADYAPGESKEAREAFQAMAAEAKLAGFELVAFSTYRSFDYQTQLYERYVNNDGQEAADRYSARPGYSEHQTGLAFDIGEQHFEQHFARESFGTTEAGKWVASHAHKYGFIMRYPQGKEKITGYMYEPWHFRYVGTEYATKIYELNTTLEEYFDL